MHFRAALRTAAYYCEYIAQQNNIKTSYYILRMTEHYFPLKISIISYTTTSFSPEKQHRGSYGPVPAKWRHSGASCSYVWRHIF